MIRLHTITKATVSERNNVPEPSIFQELDIRSNEKQNLIDKRPTPLPRL